MLTFFKTGEMIEGMNKPSHSRVDSFVEIKKDTVYVKKHTVSFIIF